MNKSNHTITLPIRDYEYLMDGMNKYSQLMRELRDACIYSKLSPDSVVINSRIIIDIYRKWLAMDSELTVG